MTKEEFMRRAIANLHLVQMPHKNHPFEDHLYFFFILEAAMHFGQHRLCDQISDELSPFVGEMFRPRHKIPAPSQHSVDGWLLQDAHERKYYRRWKYLIGSLPTIDKHATWSESCPT